MKIEIDNTVIEILEKEAKTRELTLEEIINQLLRSSAMLSELNDGKINSSETPTGL